MCGVQLSARTLPQGSLIVILMENRLCNSSPFGEDEVTVMKNQEKDVLTWFDGKNNFVSTWYLVDF